MLILDIFMHDVLSGKSLADLLLRPERFILLQFSHHCRQPEPVMTCKGLVDILSPFPIDMLVVNNHYLVWLLLYL